MKAELLENKIKELNNENSGYVLLDEALFYDIGYRVMRNQRGKSLLKCNKLKYNGHTKFLYFTEGLISFEQLLMRGDESQILLAIRNLFEAIAEVGANGFLNVACIDSRLSKIFLDQSNFEAKMIYLPLNLPTDGLTKDTFEHEIRGQLQRGLQMSAALQSPAIQKVAQMLSDGAILNLEELVGRMQNMVVNQSSTLNRGQENSSRENRNQQFTRQSLDMASRVQGNLGDEIFLCSTERDLALQIEPDKEFLVGKSAERADGVIPGNSAISRTHCFFQLRNGSCYIKDNQSANGTFVNGMRLTPGEWVEIQNDSKIKLANEVFILRNHR